MPLKISKPSANPPFPKREEHDCSEERLKEIAGELAPQLRARDIVILDGPLGAGKSTFARFVLEALGVERQTTGSPTYAITHQYQAREFEAAHVDLYRLEREQELQEAGIEALLWESDALVLVEWLSRFPQLQREVGQYPRPGGRVCMVRLAFSDRPERRSLELS